MINNIINYQNNDFIILFILHHNITFYYLLSTIINCKLYVNDNMFNIILLIKNVLLYMNIISNIKNVMFG